MFVRLDGWEVAGVVSKRREMEGAWTNVGSSSSSSSDGAEQGDRRCTRNKSRGRGWDEARDDDERGRGKKRKSVRACVSYILTHGRPERRRGLEVRSLPFRALDERPLARPFRTGRRPARGTCSVRPGPAPSTHLEVLRELDGSVSL